MYKIRVILDAKEDVIRTLIVDENESLENLHFNIARSFGFDAQEMASFYRVDEDWNQGEEIPLFNMAEAGESISMSNCITKETFVSEGDKLIYVYDFLDMWTFYVEAVDVNSKTIDTAPKTILSVGEIPEEAPKKEFVSESFDDDDSDFESGFEDDFESLDDIDFDNY